MPIFITLFHEVVKKGKLPSSLYKLRVNLIPKIKTSPPKEEKKTFKLSPSMNPNPKL